MITENALRITSLKKERLERMGIRTFGDLQSVFRKAVEVTDRASNVRAFESGGVKTLFNTDTGKLFGIRPIK